MLGPPLPARNGQEDVAAAGFPHSGVLSVEDWTTAQAPNLIHMRYLKLRYLKTAKLHWLSGTFKKTLFLDLVIILCFDLFCLVSVY